MVMSAENKTKKKAKVKLLFLGTYQKLLKGTNIFVLLEGIIEIIFDCWLISISVNLC